MIFSSTRNLAFVLMLICGALHAAEITYEADTNALWIVGQIERGDANRFRDTISTPPRKQSTITVHLASSGGDVIEGMKIGRQLRELFIPAFESTILINGKCLSVPASTSAPTEVSERAADSCGCHSACFVIWAGSPYRTGGPVEEGGPDGFGIHRPRFDSTYFANLTAAEAETEYSRLTNLVMLYLKEMGIPDELAEKMFAISSGEIYLLSDSEIESLQSPPAIAEWLASKCGEISKGDRSDLDSYMFRDIQGELESKDYLSEIERRHYKLLADKIHKHLQCEGDAVKTEQASRR